MRDSFILYTKYSKQLACLTNVQKGVLLSAIFAYEMDEELPEMDAHTYVAFSFIAVDLDENARKYDEKCEKNKENGKKGGRPRKPNVTEKTERFLKNRTQAKKADNDNDNYLKEKDITTLYPKRKDLADCEALILNDGSEWKPTQDEFDEYTRLYPSVDIRQEFRSMRGWCSGNPTKRKTARGIKRFVTSWLSRSQDKPSRPSPNLKVEPRNYDMDDLERQLYAAQKG